MSKAGTRTACLVDDNGRLPLVDRTNVLQSQSLDALHSRTPPVSGRAFSPACFPHSQRPHVRHGLQNMYAEGGYYGTTCTVLLLWSEMLTHDKLRDKWASLCETARRHLTVEQREHCVHDAMRQIKRAEVVAITPIGYKYALDISYYVLWPRLQ
eukprot:3742175-Amphidinium_carterae.2